MHRRFRALEVSYSTCFWGQLVPTLGLFYSAIALFIPLGSANLERLAKARKNTAHVSCWSPPPTHGSAVGGGVGCHVHPISGSPFGFSAQPNQGFQGLLKQYQTCMEKIKHWPFHRLASAKDSIWTKFGCKLSSPQHHKEVGCMAHFKMY